MNKVDDIVLNEETYLVEKIEGYYAKARKEGFSTETDKHNDELVGIIRKVSDDMPDYQKYVGNIIYYRKKMSPVISFKGINTFHLVGKRTMLAIRSDQTENNY